MRNIFEKKNTSLRLEGTESAISSEEITGEAEDDGQSEEAETKLSIHPKWDLPKEDIYSYQFLQLECPPLRSNQISIAGIKLDQNDDGDIDATVFIRQTLNKSIELGETKFALLDHNDQVLGRTTLDLKSLGKLPACSSRPWVIPFKKEDLHIDEKPADGWKVVFQLKPSARKHSLDLDAKWQKTLANKDIDQLQALVDRLDSPKSTEVNLMGLKAKTRESGDIQVILLIRNGSEKTVNLEKIPLVLEDAAGEVLAKAAFSPENLKVKANTSKPWVFVFPKKMLKKESYSLNQWKVYMPNKNNSET